MGRIKFRRTSKNFWVKTRVNQVSSSREVLFLTGNPNCLIGFPLFLSYHYVYLWTRTYCSYFDLL